MIVDKYLATTSEITESALKELMGRAEENGLRVILFTRVYKVLDFSTPKLNGETLVQYKETKYLGIILDSKLSWNRNAKERIKKGINAYYTCRKMFRRKWGLQP